MSFPSLQWLEQVRQRVNADAEMQVIGDWFTTSFSLGFGEQRFALHVERGKITNIVPSPRFDVRCAFGFRAPVDVWLKFVSRESQPMFHDFFAMLMRVPEFVLEGDGLVAMQNARALHRMMNVLRTVEA